MAGRIPSDFIQELLARTDIVEVIGARIELQRAGREFKARSPFTDEKTPSFFVSPAKQMFFDFSSGKNGTVISFVMDFDHVGFVDAVEMLASRAGLEVPREGGRAAGTPAQDAARQALAQATELFRSALSKSTEAQAYLKQRGISPETVERFAIGYAPAAWDFLSTRISDRSAALAAGLVKRRPEGDACYDVFRHRLMFPIRDARGRTLGFGGRTLGDDPAKYLNTPETALFHKGRNLFGLYEARQSGRGAPQELIIVEGYIDAAMLSQHGVTNVVATLGTATTSEHLALLFRTVRRVAFCFDGDRAGRSAAARVLEPLLPQLRAGLECRFAFLPEGEDPDTLVQKEGHDAFAARIAQAEPLAQFLLDRIAGDCDLSSVGGRARFIDQARKPLAQLRDPALRALLSAAIAERVGLPYADVQRLLEARPARAAAPPVAEEPRARAAAPTSRSLRRAVQLLGERPALAQRVIDLKQLALAPVPGIAELIAALEFFAEHPNSSCGHLLESRRHEAGAPDLLQELWSRPLAGVDDETLTDEFDAAIARLRLRGLRRSYQELLQKAAHDGMSDAIANELTDLTRQLSRASNVQTT
ncbi:MAG TPA: DNA primase [Nevskiaceae bacterium]